VEFCTGEGKYARLFLFRLGVAHLRGRERSR
jgi:hypothetical protein